MISKVLGAHRKNRKVSRVLQIAVMGQIVQRLCRVQFRRVPFYAACYTIRVRQGIEMGNLHDSSPNHERLFSEVFQAFGRSPPRLCQVGPFDVVALNYTGQLTLPQGEELIMKSN